jgi:hypothetical protein
MFGFINDAFENFIKSTYSDDVWVKIVRIAECSVPNTGWQINATFSDETTFCLVAAASNILCHSTEKILEDLGLFVLSFAR